MKTYAEIAFEAYYGKEHSNWGGFRALTENSKKRWGAAGHLVAEEAQRRVLAAAKEAPVPPRVLPPVGGSMLPSQGQQWANGSNYSSEDAGY